MKKTIRILFLTMIILVLSISFTACKDNSGKKNPSEQNGGQIDDDDDDKDNDEPDENIELYKVTEITAEPESTYIGSISYGLATMGTTNYSARLTTYNEDYFKLEYIFSTTMAGTDISTYMGRTELSEAVDGISDITFHFVLELSSGDKYFSFKAKLDDTDDTITDFKPYTTNGMPMNNEVILYSFEESSEKSGENISAVYIGSEKRLTGASQQVIIVMMTTYLDNSFFLEYSFKSAAESFDGHYSGEFTNVIDSSGEFYLLTFSFKFGDGQTDHTIEADTDGGGYIISYFRPYYKEGVQFGKDMSLNSLINSDYEI